MTDKRYQYCTRIEKLAKQTTKNDNGITIFDSAMQDRFMDRFYLTDGYKHWFYVKDVSILNTNPKEQENPYLFANQLIIIQFLDKSDTPVIYGWLQSIPPTTTEENEHSLNVKQLLITKLKRCIMEYEDRFFFNFKRRASVLRYSFCKKSLFGNIITMTSDKNNRNKWLDNSINYQKRTNIWVGMDKYFSDTKNWLEWVGSTIIMKEINVNQMINKYICLHGVTQGLDIVLRYLKQVQ